MEKLARQHLRGSLVRSESSPKGGICVSRGREPAVGVVSPHPSRVAAAAFHEFVCRRWRGSVSLRAPNRGLTPAA